MTIRSVFTYSSRQIHELEGRANENPDDADAQAEYLKVICVQLTLATLSHGLALVFYLSAEKLVL